MAEIIDRTPMGLIDGLCDRIRKALVSYWYKAEQHDDGDNEDYHEPFVHAQYLPVTKTAEDGRLKSKDYPLVRVMVTTGSITDLSEVKNGSEINIQIYFGGYDEDADRQGWRLPMAMLWSVLIDLLANTIIGAYKLDTPIKWSALETKEPPYYAAAIESVWRGAPPAIEIPVGIVDLPGKESTEKITAADTSGKPENQEAAKE